MKNTIISLGFLLIFQQNLKAQDYHFSQFDVSEVSLNPAYTGQFKDHLYRSSMIHRNQWRSLVVKPFSAFNISFEMPLSAKRWGLGGYINNYDGTNIYNEFNLVFSGSYRITSPNQDKHILTTGLQTGFINKNINDNDLTFDSQYDNGGFSDDLSTLETFDRFSKFMPEINWGIYYKYNKYEDFSFYGGFSLFHISSPKNQFVESTVDKSSRLPRRYVLHGGFSYELSQSYTIEVKTREMWQGLASEYYFGAELEYIIDRYLNSRIKWGVFYRHLDAVVPMVGFEYKSLSFATSYDITVSGLKKYNNSLGALEFTLKYAPRKRWIAKF